MRELLLEARHTHLYPGLRGTVFGRLASPTGGEASTCQIAFSDGSMALGRLEDGGESDCILETDPYTTAAGTEVPAKKWRIALNHGDGGAGRFRVLARLDTPRHEP